MVATRFRTDGTKRMPNVKVAGERRSALGKRRIGNMQLELNWRASWSFAARQFDVVDQALEEGLLTGRECDKGAADVMHGALAFPC